MILALFTHLIAITPSLYFGNSLNWVAGAEVVTGLFLRSLPGNLCCLCQQSGRLRKSGSVDKGHKRSLWNYFMDSSRFFAAKDFTLWNKARGLRRCVGWRFATWN